MKQEIPLVSVLLPVYNGENFLGESIKSILLQTFSNFELLIINDGSVDKTDLVLSEFKDARIKSIHHDSNKGLIYSLNEGIQLASGKYIARMDADDIALPERLQKQVEFLESHPDVGVCGSQIITFGENSKNWNYPLSSDAIKITLLFHCCIAHPTVLLRSSILKQTNLLYKENFKHAEDYELWSQLISKTNFANLPVPLLKYRMHEHSVSAVQSKIQNENCNRIRETQLRKLGIEENETIKLFNELSSLNYLQTEIFLAQSEKLLQTLVSKNKQMKIYNENLLDKIIADKFFDICNSTTTIGLKNYKIFKRSIFSKNISTRLKLKLKLKCLLKINSNKSV